MSFRKSGQTVRKTPEGRNGSEWAKNRKDFTKGTRRKGPEKKCGE